MKRITSGIVALGVAADAGGNRMECRHLKRA